MIINEQNIKNYNKNGFLIIDNFIKEEIVDSYIQQLDLLVNGKINPGKQRNDLGAHNSKQDENIENITQIMLPSDFLPSLIESEFFTKSKQVAIELLGNDIDRDMDMYIEKAPLTNTETPWHQDSAYWPKGMKDIRSLSCWLAFDDVTVDNGCMWYVPGSHLEPKRKHSYAGEGSDALVAECSEDEGIACPIKKGGMIIHDGRILHYSRGNSTQQRRRALITNYRPVSMIKWERSIGFDHREELENLDEN
tara:strand:+ start:295 stop:1044 length:750 start_codon:yes stop_codon:yes gene_type:complete